MSKNVYESVRDDAAGCLITVVLIILIAVLLVAQMVVEYIWVPVILLVLVLILFLLTLPITLGIKSWETLDDFEKSLDYLKQRKKEVNGLKNIISNKQREVEALNNNRNTNKGSKTVAADTLSRLQSKLDSLQRPLNSQAKYLIKKVQIDKYILSKYEEQCMNQSSFHNTRSSKFAYCTL